jgi:ribosomal protein L35AE/L33A
MNPKLKQIIKNKLSEDFSSVSIINYNGSIWFIDAKSKYWYLELYKKTKTLWWRLDFFEDFFLLFSMEQREFVPIIIEWVQEVLNGKVASTRAEDRSSIAWVEEVLNGKVVSTHHTEGKCAAEVEEVLDGKILSTVGNLPPSQVMVEKVLKGEVISTYRQKRRQETQVEEILKSKGFSHDFVQEAIVQELFKNMIETTTPDSNSDYSRVEDALNSI